MLFRGRIKILPRWILLHGFFQITSSCKFRNFVGGNFNRNSCLGIPSHAGFSLSYRKSPKAYNGYLLAFLQGSSNASSQRIEGCFRFRFGQTCFFCNFSYKITLIQSAPLSAPLSFKYLGNGRVIAPHDNASQVKIIRFARITARTALNLPSA